MNITETAYTAFTGTRIIEESRQAVFKRATPVWRIVVSADGSVKRRRVDSDHFTKVELIGLIKEVSKAGGDIKLLNDGLAALSAPDLRNS